eukprot:SAG31_NODE_2114_length_6416_cov_25.024379_5_plen_132_part_00
MVGLPVLGPDDLPSVLGRADAILLGSPVCSGRPSLPMAAFLEHCSTITYIPAASLAGKVGLPFCCYGQRGDLSAAAGVCQTLLGFFMEAGMLALGNVPISKEPCVALDSNQFNAQLDVCLLCFMHTREINW